MSRDEQLSGQIGEAIDSVAELERRALEDASLHQRAIERLTHALGRPRSVYVVIFFVAAWLLANAILAATGREPFDSPPFPWLTGMASVAALLMTVVIVTTENRMTEIEEQRARLHLQISLLADRKTAKIIQLLEELRRDLPSVPDRHDALAQEMTTPSDPHEVASELERRTLARGGSDEAPGA
ncbi:MAG TPA: DUF1003 domain-containing protein [Candidatus Limnocylindria bacterium]|nr:DUF1003 domain-containing protein [Candidatus Limnocylindria bacterium]